MVKYITKNEEISAIEDALEVLLTAVSHDRKSRNIEAAASGKAPTFTLMKASELSLERLPTRMQSYIFNIAGEEPDAVNLFVIHILGARLFEITKSTDKMRESLERVAARSRENYGRWLSIVDSRWNGVGDWVS